jgi:hypothetical protein
MAQYIPMHSAEESPRGPEPECCDAKGCQEEPLWYTSRKAWLCQEHSSPYSEPVLVPVDEDTHQVVQHRA